jgi:hypothetical protein
MQMVILAEAFSEHQCIRISPQSLGKTVSWQVHRAGGMTTAQDLSLGSVPSSEAEGGGW